MARRYARFCPRSPSTQAGERETLWPCGGLREAFKAARRSVPLQCAPLPDRDQHRSTIPVPRTARCPLVGQAEAPGLPPSSPSQHDLLSSEASVTLFGFGSGKEEDCYKTSDQTLRGLSKAPSLPSPTSASGEQKLLQKLV